ncbi:MAG: addiction module protein [Lentisphaeria bacterium]
MSKTINMDELTTSEKILLVEELWDDIATRHPDDVPLTAAQQQDLKQRLAYLQQNPNCRHLSHPSSP